MKVDFDTTVAFRFNKKQKENFETWCKKANKEYQDVLREVMVAGPEGRLTIKPDTKQKKALKELYK